MTPLCEEVLDRIKTTTLANFLPSDGLQLVVLGTLYSLSDWTHMEVRAEIARLEEELRAKKVIV